MFCNGCSLDLPEENFYILKNGYVRKRCRNCRSKYRRNLNGDVLQNHLKTKKEWESKNRLRINELARLYRKNNPDKFKSYHLKKDFGISKEYFDELLKKQNYVCALCKQPEKSVHKKTNRLKDLSVDHCHKTNKIRGLLCWVCNTGIGKMQDSPELLRKAADYIESYR